MVHFTWHDEIDSTMDEIHRLAAAAAPHGTAVAAATQRAARGRMGRRWRSPIGGCWLSVLIRDIDSSALEPLSPRLGLAVAQALEQAIPALPKLALKWPNDILLGRRKLAGVLVEARWRGGSPEWLTVGLGVNISNPIPAELELSATAVAAVTTPPDPGELAQVLAGVILAATGRVGALGADELVEWNRRDILHGHRIDTPLAGVAQGIASTGALRVRRSDGRMVEIRTGDVAADAQQRGGGSR